MIMFIMLIVYCRKKIISYEVYENEELVFMVSGDFFSFNKEIFYPEPRPWDGVAMK